MRDRPCRRRHRRCRRKGLSNLRPTVGAAPLGVPPGNCGGGARRHVWPWLTTFLEDKCPRCSPQLDATRVPVVACFSAEELLILTSYSQIACAIESDQARNS